MEDLEIPRLREQLELLEHQLDECRMESLRKGGGLRDKISEMRILKVVNLPRMKTAVRSVEEDNQKVEVQLAKKLTEVHDKTESLLRRFSRLKVE